VPVFFKDGSATEQLPIVCNSLYLGAAGYNFLARTMNMENNLPLH